jgi:hypothetical protein
VATGEDWLLVNMVGTATKAASTRVVRHYSTG